ncbi:hypothetical protein GOP47_0027477 [Adiantum capillus-veneris]|nr:hypothetical protein GOP47_0027477 [Adiantum capillus-veneris]
MRDARCLTLHLIVTYRAFIASLGFLLILTMLLGFFTSFSTVHRLALLGPLKCLDDLTQPHIQETYSFALGRNKSDDLKGDDLLNTTYYVEEIDDDAIDELEEGFLHDINRESIGKLLNSTIYDDGQDTDSHVESRATLFSPTQNLKPLANNGDSRTNSSTCNKNDALVKVFMYDLSPEFHFGMIEPMSSQEEIWPNNLSSLARYPGGLYEQHSPEYWLTLDLLINTELLSLDDGRLIKERSCGAFRVKNESEADVFFVPFFSSLSYNRYKKSAINLGLQRKLVEFLEGQEAWRRTKGRDHVVMMHHPNSLHWARQHLRNAIFVVADFGRYPPHIANLEKDVVAPYQHIIPSMDDDEAVTTTFESRRTLLFFQGVIARKQGGTIRRRLYNILNNETGVEFKSGHFNSQGPKGVTSGMRSAKFCLHLAGDTPSSNRLFDAISSHCVPVIISKAIELPYEGMIDYTKFCLFVSHIDALKKGFLVDFLRSINKEEWSKLWRNLREIQQHFEYQFPSQRDDAVHMIWKSISHKIPLVRKARHKAQRYHRSHGFFKDGFEVEQL